MYIIQQSYFFSGIYQKKKMKSLSWDICIPMFIAALFTIAKKWKQVKCPSMDEWIEKMWYTYIYIYSMEYYSSMRKKEILSFATICMGQGLEGIMLREVRQRKTNTGHPSTMWWLGPLTPMWLKIVIPWFPQRTGSRTCLGYQNPQMLKSYCWPLVFAVSHPRIQPTADNVVCIYWKKSTYKCTYTVQTYAVQGQLYSMVSRTCGI